MLKRISTILFFCTAFTVPCFAAGQEELMPHQIIQTAASSISGKLKGRRDYLNEHREELYKLINEILVPHFDMRYAGRLVLGKHWKTATKNQRDRFIDAFYKFLLQSYANGVLKFEEGQVDVHPVEVKKDENRVVVKTDMRMDDGSLVPVNYSMRKSRQEWRVYDVRIEGVSYIRNYRNQFNAEISELGIEAVIERLRTETEKSAKTAVSRENSPEPNS